MQRLGAFISDKCEPALAGRINTFNKGCDHAQCRRKGIFYRFDRKPRCTSWFAVGQKGGFKRFKHRPDVARSPASQRGCHIELMLIGIANHLDGQLINVGIRNAFKQAVQDRLFGEPRFGPDLRCSFCCIEALGE